MFCRLLANSHAYTGNNLQVDSTPSEEPLPPYSPESFAYLNVEHVPSITSWLNAPTEDATAGNMLCYRHMRVLRDYKDDAHKKLREGLEWMFDNELQPKLDGRYLWDLSLVHVQGVW